jgi:hypothetical protein
MVLGEKNEDFPPYAQHATHPSTHSLNQPFNPSVCPVLIVEPIDFQPI